MKRAVIAIALVAALAAGCSGVPPTNLGVRDGQLAPPPESPNGVSSQARKDDEEHWIAPLVYAGARDEAVVRAVAALESLPRVEIVERRADYVRAEATSFLFRFVDDVELWFPENERIVHVRSASRKGHSDFGANRRRIEALREKLAGGS